MRIFQVVIPLHVRAVFGVTAHQFDRFGHDIDRFRAAHGDAVLRFNPEDALHGTFFTGDLHGLGQICEDLRPSVADALT